MRPDISLEILDDLHFKLVRRSADVLAKIFSARSGSEWTGTVAEEQPSAATPPAGLCASLRFTGGLGGELLVLLQSPHSGETQSLLETSGEQQPDQVWGSWLEEAGEAWQQILPAGCSPASIVRGALNAAPGNGCVLGTVVLTRGSQAGVDRVLLYADAALDRSLAKVVTGNGPLAADEAEAFSQQPKIERVIDVPLHVMLRFGQRHLTLREVLALTTGSLVELDRQVEEPVDLVLGDRLIARGEVVIVDGNYGLRVTEVIEAGAHRLDRLQAGIPEATEVPQA